MSNGTQAALDPSASRGTPAACPTFMLGASERGVHTRGSADSGRRGGRYVSEVTLQFSHTNEPWLKYTVAGVADRGLKRAAWTSARMRKEVLYLETARGRYELAWEGLLPSGASLSAEEAASLDAFTFSKCRGAPLDLDATRAAGVPLPKSALEVLARGVSWEAIKWGVTGVYVAGVHYPVVRILFMPAAKPQK